MTRIPAGETAVLYGAAAAKAWVRSGGCIAPRRHPSWRKPAPPRAVTWGYWNDPFADPYNDPFCAPEDHPGRVPPQNVIERTGHRMLDGAWNAVMALLYPFGRINVPRTRH